MNDIEGVYVHFAENLEKVFSESAFAKILEGKYVSSTLFIILIVKSAIYLLILIWAL